MSVTLTISLGTCVAPPPSADPIVPQSEVTRAILSGYSPCVVGPRGDQRHRVGRQSIFVVGSRGLEREAAETELLVAPRVQIEDLRQLTAAVGIAHRDLLRL